MGREIKVGLAVGRRNSGARRKCKRNAVTKVAVAHRGSQLIIDRNRSGAVVRIRRQCEGANLNTAGIVGSCPIVGA